MTTKVDFHLKTLFFFFFLYLALGTPSPRLEARLIDRTAPEISNEVWINSAPIRLANLRGKVVLLEFWTYG